MVRISLFAWLLFQVESSPNLKQPIPLCEILEHLREYDGKTITVRGTFSLEGDCNEPQAPDDPRYPAPRRRAVNAIVAEFPSGAEFVEPFKSAIQQSDRHWQQGYDSVATFVGRLDVKRVGGTGFGHLGSFPARLNITSVSNVARGKKIP